jgi:hypothetical protein
MKPLALGAILLLACAGVQTRRVVVPNDDTDAERCFEACVKSSTCPPGKPCAPGQFACLETCRGARVESGPCAGAELRANERCWTNKGPF